MRILGLLGKNVLSHHQILAAGGVMALLNLIDLAEEKPEDFSVQNAALGALRNLASLGLETMP